jgi:signal transduction histidine kinase
VTTRTGRLRLTGYLGAMVLVFVIGGLFAAFMIVESLPSAELRALTRHASEQLYTHRGDPARFRTDFDELARTRLAITLYDADHRLIASSVEPPLPARMIDDPDARPPLTFVHPLREGDRVVAYAICAAQRPPLRRLLTGLAVLLAALVLLVVLIARHVGQPMERIADAARRFGRGELSARAGLGRKDELGEVGRAFDEMADRVTLLMTTQRELMANVSHELQTPLARIQVAVDLMTDGVDGQAKELLPEVAVDLGEVERLIEDMMTLARFDLAHAEGLAAGAPLRREPTALAELTERAAARFRTTHAQRRLDFTVAAPLPTLAIDPVLMLRVLDNLLDNARKYSEPDTAIALEARATTDGGVAITVRDRGIGIDADDLARVFTPFFRTDRSRSRKTGGVGLGLGLARRVVEAHGGAIALASTPNQGTTVTVTLPADPGATATSPPAPGRASP